MPRSTNPTYTLFGSGTRFAVTTNVASHIGVEPLWVFLPSNNWIQLRVVSSQFRVMCRIHSSKSSFKIVANGEVL